MRILLIAIALASACGSQPANQNGSMSIELGNACQVDTDCPSPAYRCVYNLADGCAAKGYCWMIPSGPQCQSLETVCGCGKNEATGCTYPPGYASGPAQSGVSGVSCIGDGG
jgi:hypothetical protein